MKRNLFSALLALTASALFAVPADQTDLPNAYGEQLKNSTFDGEWNDNNEPADNSWHSFATASNSGFGTGAAITKEQTNFKTDDLRPGAFSGGKSALVKAREIKILITVNANGNFTTGRVHAGSASAKDVTKNYARTVRTEPAYNTPFASKPDSVSVWVKFSTNSDDNIGRVSVVLHGDTDCQDPLSRSSDRDLVAGVAETEFTREEQQWRRLSIPYKYFGESYISYSNFSKCEGSQEYAIADVDPKYILVTATTNKTPGVGSGSDELLIDDFLMIYNPTLTLGELSPTSYAQGETIEVSYTLEGTMSPYNSLEAKNKVILQLSDANGSFENPTVLNEVETDVTGTISGEIPESIEDGLGYRVRIVTTNYPMTSADNGADITISTSTDLPTYMFASVNIAPNPAQDVVEISNFDVAQAEIFNLQGQCVWSVSGAVGNRIDVSTLPIGSYILQVRGTDGQVARTKLLINR